jgi:hypothetical protein
MTNIDEKEKSISEEIDEVFDKLEEDFAKISLIEKEVKALKKGNNN